MNAVFRSTNQALFVSYLMEVLPATAKGPTQNLVSMLMKAAGVYDEKRAENEGTVDFSGLTVLEVRAQCALVLSACVSHLTGNELTAIHVRFAHRRLQATGVRALRELCVPVIGDANEWMQLALIWNAYGPRGKRDDFSLDAISKEYGVKRSTLWDMQRKIRQVQKSLERRAICVLDGYFQRTGLVDAEIYENA